MLARSRATANPDTEVVNPLSLSQDTTAAVSDADGPNSSRYCPGCSQ